jgi:hypothetical protein
MSEVNYHREREPAVFQGKPITVTHLTPALTPQQRERRKQEIESRLYEIFSKYTADATTHEKAR